MRKLLSVIAALMLSLAPSLAPASPSPSLGGDLVTCGGEYCPPSTAYVGSGVEFAVNYVLFVDVQASSIALSYSNDPEEASSLAFPAVYLFTIGDLNFSPNAVITGFVITDRSGIAGDFSASDLSFTANSVSFDLGGLTFARGWGSTALLTIQTREIGPAVPEPATLALLGLGLAGLAALRCRTH